MKRDPSFRFDFATWRKLILLVTFAARRDDLPVGWSFYRASKVNARVVPGQGRKVPALCFFGARIRRMEAGDEMYALWQVRPYE
jgi:hypothetical protein